MPSGAVAHHHARVARVEVAPVVAHGEIFNPHAGDAHDEARAPAARVDDGALLSPNGDARVDLKRRLERVDALFEHDHIAVLGVDHGVVKLGEGGDLEGARLRAGDPEEPEERSGQHKPRERVHDERPQFRRSSVMASYG